MNILIIKTGALGDVVRTSFLAQAIKEKFSRYNPKIFWVTDKNAIPLFINNPYVYRVLKQEDINQLKEINFDKVINLEEGEELCKFASSVSKGELIGFAYVNGKIVPTPTAQEWFNMSALGEKPQNDILKKENKKTHRQIMAEIIKIKNYEKYEPFLRLSKKQRQITDNFLRVHNISRSDLIIGFNPSGGNERWNKNLPIKKTVWLIEQLYKKYKATIILLGGPNEIERNKKIISQTKVPVISAGCGNSLVEFPAIISVCSLIITTNSLALHIALALKRKTIVVIGPTSPAEIEMYGLGEKIIAKSNCIGCYKKNCKSIEKIDIKEVFNSVEKLISQKIILVITAFKEPKIKEAIDAALNQNTDLDYEVVVSAPDKATLDIAENSQKTNKKLKIFKDPGQGKSKALNLIFSKFKADIIILTDGDVTLSLNTVQEIADNFNDPEIGCLTGRPVPLEDKKKKYGYWANFLFDSAHKWRKQAAINHDFLECSGYLFAFRKNYITQIPVDTAEDTVIPYYFWEKGYKIGYADKAEVQVTNADNWKDWISQKTRTSRGHATLHKYVDIKTTPKVKTFKNEAKGIYSLLTYPQNFKEFFWTFELALARLYMWALVFYKINLKKQTKIDNWERVESAR